MAKMMSEEWPMVFIPCSSCATLWHGLIIISNMKSHKCEREAKLICWSYCWKVCCIPSAANCIASLGILQNKTTITEQKKLGVFSTRSFNFRTL